MTAADIGMGLVLNDINAWWKTAGTADESWNEHISVIHPIQPVSNESSIINVDINLSIQNL